MEIKNKIKKQHRTCLTHTSVSLTHQCLMNNCHLVQSIVSTTTITLKIFRHTQFNTNTNIDKS